MTGRPHLRFRISATGTCNHDCFFCHNEGISKNVGHLDPQHLRGFLNVSELIPPDEVILTGGEWTIVPHASELLRVLGEMTPLPEILALSTNGTRLDRFLPQILELPSVQLRISLHAFDSERFREITGHSITKVLRSVERACHLGLRVTLNFTVTEIGGPEELRKVLQYAASVGVTEVKVLDLLTPRVGLAPKMDRRKPRLRPQEAVELALPTIANATVEDPGEMLGATIQAYQHAGLLVRVKRSDEGRFLGPACNSCSLRGSCSEGLYALRLTPDLRIKSCLLREDLDVDCASYIERGDTEGLAKVLTGVLDEVWGLTASFEGN